MTRWISREIATLRELEHTSGQSEDQATPFIEALRECLTLLKRNGAEVRLQPFIGAENVLLMNHSS